MSNDFFKNMVKNIKDDMVTMMEDGLGAGEFTGYIDTGSYVMNAVISADIFGGMHNNKAIALAGESTTGKSFFTMGIMKYYQQQYKDAGIMYYETEGAVNKADMAQRGIDVSRVMLGEPTTISEFRTKAMTLLNKYIETPRKERPPLMLVLDSLGMLSTTKEITDITEGNDKKDLTRSQEIRGAFRALRLRMAKAGIPMIITNHTYACLVPGTMVIMADGSKKAIEEIVEGDSVLTMVGPKSIAATVAYEDADVFELELEDGTKITATPNHHFMTQDMEWKTVAELSEGDSIVAMKGI